MDYVPPKVLDENSRRLLARILSKHYDELADAGDDPSPAKFSLARVLDQMATPHGLRAGYEREVCSAAAAAAGESFDRHRVLIPLRAIRTMVAATGSSGGYLVGTETPAAVDTLKPWSVVAQAGVTFIPGAVGNLKLPRVTGNASATWQTTETGNYSNSDPVVGSVPLSPKVAAVTLNFSRQWLLQAQSAEAFLRQQLLRSVGELLDAAFFTGSGSNGEPTGLLNTAGIGTQSGTSLAHAGILAMRQAVLAAGGREEALRWVSTPAVQQTLGARERSAGGGRFLWDSDGILGAPAHATKTAPTGALIAGDFTAAVVALWGGDLRLEVNPYQVFEAGVLGARVALTVDVAFPQPAAFCVAATVT